MPNDLCELMRVCDRRQACANDRRRSSTGILDQVQPVAESSKAPWQRAQMAARGPLMAKDSASSYDGWLRDSEAQAMVRFPLVVE
jgi:hypothetical protein